MMYYNVLTNTDVTSVTPAFSENISPIRINMLKLKLDDDNFLFHKLGLSSHKMQLFKFSFA